jgi:hypothetical protein
MFGEIDAAITLISSALPYVRYRDEVFYLFKKNIILIFTFIIILFFKMKGY